ncbi:MAG TPA: hypothetical protein VKA67_00115 [Verrucomicrobiae bacterium]|nr:hypothetical protein [Verrucomicrobiae bacterium]
MSATNNFLKWYDKLQADCRDIRDALEVVVDGQYVIWFHMDWLNDWLNDYGDCVFCEFGYEIDAERQPVDILIATGQFCDVRLIRRFKMSRYEFNKLPKWEY